MNLEIIIAIGVLLGLAIIAPLFSPFFRKVNIPDEDESCYAEDGNDETLPQVSIIITDHDNAYQLSQIIDSYLDQHYPVDFQVIVVVDETDHESIDVLKQRSSNTHLYYTKLPVSSRYLSRKKLAMTVGIRAAKYDWCILTSVYCHPDNSQWLRTFCKNITVNNKQCADDDSQLETRGTQPDLVLGMTPYEHETSKFYRYEQLRSMLYHLHSAEIGTAFSTNQLLVALHKDDFFRQQGFAGNLEYQRAEFEFLVNKFAKSGTSAIAVTPNSRLSCKRPTKKQWYYRHMHCIDSFKKMKHSGTFRILFHLDMCIMHLYNLLTIIACATGVCGIAQDTLISSVPENLKIFGTQESTTLLVSAISIWLLSQCIRIFIYKKKLSYFDNVNPIEAIFFDWLITIRNIWIRVRYCFTSKYDFMTHRL